MPTDPECSFCRVAGAAVPAHIVFEDEATLACLDHRPLFPGHCLLIPREPYVTLGDLPDGRVGRLFLNAKALSRAVEAALSAEGSFVAVNNRVSQSVPHLHIHVVPRRRKDGLRGFFWPRQKYRDEEEAQAVQEAIRQAVGQAAGGLA